ncbi:MAG: hypothetical protein ACJ8DC_19215 [Gemmatimonadales bacterium]
MDRNFTLFLIIAVGTVPAAAGAQAAADTLPERVVERTYDAVNRCDAAAYGSFFAPVHYHSKMVDTTEVAERQSRDGVIRALPDYCKSPKVRFKMIRRIVLGPYVVDEQDVVEQGAAHLDIFEVRKGKIVHEWESDLFPPGASSRP